MNDLKKKHGWLYWFLFAVAVIVVYKTLDNFTAISIWFSRLFEVILPFLSGALIAYILYIPCRYIEAAFRRNKKTSKYARPLSILSVYLITVLFIIFLINIIFPTISKSIVDLASNLPGYYARAKAYIDIQPEDSFWKNESITEIINELEQIEITKIVNKDNITEDVGKVVVVARGIFSTFVAIIISIYILLERTDILKFIRRLNKAIFSTNTCKKMDRYFEETNMVFSKYISSQITDGIIVGIIMSIALSIMKVKYAILLGFMIGLFNVIPYFGAIFSIIIAAVITIFTGGFGKAIWMAIITTILQQIDANIINPKIVKDALKISRILIIFAVTVGGAYFGFLGMFLGVPIIAVIKTILNDFIENKNKVKKIEK